MYHYLKLILKLIVPIFVSYGNKADIDIVTSNEIQLSGTLMESKLMSVYAPLLCCLVLVLTGCTTPPGKADEGARWYSMYRCNGCHGEQGAKGKGPELAGQDISYWSFKNRIRYSRSSIMPSYSKDKIPDQDIADMYAFLQLDQ